MICIVRGKKGVTVFVGIKEQVYLPIEQYICFTIDHLTNVHLCHILVIVLVPLFSHHILTVRRVMTTYMQKHRGKYIYI